MDTQTVSAILKVQSLGVAYGARRILTNFHLELQAGSCTAIVGYSGAGKSTILQSVVGLCEADSGDAWLKGERFLNSGKLHVQPWSLRRSLTLVTQHSGLLPHMTVRDNLLLAATRIARMTGDGAIERAQEVARQLGVERELAAYPGQLSGGELQRAHLARALVLQPPVLLLDEVTSNVDPRTAELIGDCLISLSNARSSATILVTHDFATVQRLANSVIFLHEGKNFEEIAGEDFPGGFRTPEARAFTTQAKGRN